MAAKSNTAQDDGDNEGLYPIRTVSTLTGVNSITLRAWERRYGLIKPVRTPKGHRLYTQNDIDLIQEILGLLDRGISIGQVRDHLGGIEKSKASSSNKQLDPWEAYQRRMINAIVRFDVHALDNNYNDALSLYPVELVTARLILPLLKTLGERWSSARGSVAEEHFFGAYLRNKLGARFHHLPIRPSGKKLLAACMPGEQHEIGLMLFCLSALSQDYQVIYLGADTPLAELLEPVKRAEVDAILLSSSIDPVEKVLSVELPQLVSTVGVPVFIGGQPAVRFRDEIVSAGAIPLGTDIAQAIRRLNQDLSAQASTRCISIIPLCTDLAALVDDVRMQVLLMFCLRFRLPFLPKAKPPYFSFFLIALFNSSNCVANAVG